MSGDIVIDQIRIADWHDAMDAIIADYYARDEKAKQGVVTHVTIDWGRLRSLERGDLTLTMGAIDDLKLVGFALYIVAEHFHHMGTMSAVCDTLAVTVDYRGRQIGSRLVKAAEPILRQRNVKLVSHGHRACYGRTPLFPKLGYKLEELIYMKELH